MNLTSSAMLPTAVGMHMEPLLTGIVVADLANLTPAARVERLHEYSGITQKKSTNIESTLPASVHAQEDGPSKILQIGNYPPPFCGWAMQTKLLAEEIRRRGHLCSVLNLNENRKRKSPDYIDVQGGVDYLWKLFRFAANGYRFQVHVNGQSKIGYILAMIAVLIGWLFGRRAAVS